MPNWINIGSSPYNEDCVQVGQHAYLNAMLVECNVYKVQLMRLFPGAKFKVKANGHDFGTYYEVYVDFDGSEDAYKAEDGCATWDEESQAALKGNEHYQAYWADKPNKPAFLEQS